ncbi:hypothetical protein ACIBBE_24565 [Streptomyces sp. NPDC051644]|uniref:hypothetical protein n=1 Tax=Streptomyces sp. NPDC051644 TaxID=3365666 RepID=UPI003793DFE3
MQRSLRRQIERAINLSWTAKNRFDRGTIGVALLFPHDAFADAPTWTPGPGFQALNNDGVTNSAFVRDNGDGTQTVVVGGIGPAQRPGRDGGVWTEEEVWTVTAPIDDFDGCGLGNNAQGITWMLDQPCAVIHREPYTTHPLAAVETYWENFEDSWGFQPRGERRYYGGWPFGEGREWAYLICRTELAHDEGDEVALLDAVVKLADLFGAEVRIYPYNLQKREITGPLGNTYQQTYIRDVKRALRK